MNKTSLLMLVVGTILGIVIGYVTFSAKPKASDSNIQAEGFGKIDYENQKFKLEIVQRVDADNLKVTKVIEFPAEGFLKSRAVIEQFLKSLADRGALGQPSAVAEPSDDSTDE